MHVEQYGNAQNPTIVFLHGAFFVHAFGRQYPLADRFHLVVPHLMGFGDEARRTFNAEQEIDELTTFIRGLGTKVTLVGFSLGAQLAVKLVAQHEDLFNGAIIVSPWLIKEEPGLTHAYRQNLKQLKQLKNRFTCTVIGFMNGLPKDRRKEFVEQMQHVSEKTVERTVYNDITLDTVAGFAHVTIPVIALAGEKEQPEIIDSVKALKRLNDRCAIEIWPKAAHNIPPLFAKEFNALLGEFVERIRED